MQQNQEKQVFKNFLTKRNKMAKEEKYHKKEAKKPKKKC